MEDEDQDLNMMLRTPTAHSPNQSTLENEVTRVKVTHSGASTPTLAIRGDPTRMSLASKRSEIEEEFWPDNKKVDLENNGAANSGKNEANGEAGIKEETSTGNNENDSNSLRANLLNSESSAS